MYYQNDFENNLGLTDWTMTGGTGLEWNITSGLLNGSTSAGKDVWLMLKNFNKDLYKVKFKAINYSGVDQNIVLKSSQNFSSHYILGFRYNESRWSQDNNSIVLYKYSPTYGYELLKYVTPSDFANKFKLSQNIWHDIEIVLGNKTVKAYFDGVQVINVFDAAVPYIGPGGFGFQSHGGTFPYVTLNSFDDLKIMSIDHIEVSPTPSPPQLKNKIIIIPGLGASWNTEAMLSPLNNTQKYEWKMAPYVKNYDSLIKAFNDKGLVKDKDYFVWNYDWRKPISAIVTDLDGYISSLGLSSDSKINIVGHSLGGVVGRIWAQEHNNLNLGKIITLGSPNYGSVDAYEAWNGAVIPDGFGAAKIGINMLLQVQKKFGKTKLDTIHSFIPVLSDLLPIFNFTKKNGVSVPYSGLTYKNIYLENKNTQTNTIFENLEAVGGYGFNSKEFLNLGERNIYDKVLGYWPDGSILSFNNTSESDGTVLKKSAVFSNDNSYSVYSKHSDLPNNYIEGVFRILGLGITQSSVAGVNESGDKVIFFIGSPAYLKVVCDDNIERNSDDLGFVVLNKDNLSNCDVSVKGTGNGTYHLVLGDSSNENSWMYYEDSINNLETKTINYDVKNGRLSNSETNRDFLYGQLINEVVSLQNYYQNNSYLINVKNFAVAKKINDIVTDFFKFRKQVRDYKKTAVVLDKIDLILRIENKDIKLSDVTAVNKKLVSDKSLVDRIARLNTVIKRLPDEFGANSYKLMDENLLKSKTNLNLGKLTDVYVDSILGSKLSNEVW